MKVEQLMTKQVRYCTSGDTLEAAARSMWEGDCGCLPVCEQDGVNRVVGVITDRDICMAALFQPRALRELPVSGAMAKQPVTCSAGDAIGDVEQRMRDARVRRLPVIDADGSLAGIITLADIAREAARERTIGTRDVTDSEVRETLARICGSHADRQHAA